MRPSSVSIEMSDTIKVLDSEPSIVPSKPGQSSSLLKNHNVATKVRALTAKAGQRNARTASTPTSQEKGPTADAPSNMLMDLVKSLLQAMEEQKET